MEALSKRSPSTPTSPRRHIHSSFPHYFYSTPTTPSSDSLSAFVALCESRLTEAAAPPPDSDSTAEFAFGFNVRSASSDAAFADDIFHEGRLLPVRAGPATTAPLKPPPRLQYIANIRKSLRMRRLRGSNVAGRKANDDPFAVAVEKVTREDASGPWCQQLPWWWSRRSSVCETCINDDDTKAERRGVVECVKSAISAKDKRRKNRVLSREESAWLVRKPTRSDDGKLVGLARRTTASTHYGSTLLACFGLK